MQINAQFYGVYQSYLAGKVLQNISVTSNYVDSVQK